MPLVGLDDEARAIYAEGVEAGATTYVMPGWLGLLAAAIGDRDAAFAHFDRGLEDRSLVLSARDDCAHRRRDVFEIGGA